MIKCKNLISHYGFGKNYNITLTFNKPTLVTMCSIPPGNVATMPSPQATRDIDVQRNDFVVQPATEVSPDTLFSGLPSLRESINYVAGHVIDDLDSTGSSYTEISRKVREINVDAEIRRNEFSFIIQFISKVGLWLSYIDPTEKAGSIYIKYYCYIICAIKTFIEFKRFELIDTCRKDQEKLREFQRKGFKECIFSEYETSHTKVKNLDVIKNSIETDSGDYSVKTKYNISSSTDAIFGEKSGSVHDIANFLTKIVNRCFHTTIEQRKWIRGIFTLILCNYSTDDEGVLPNDFKSQVDPSGKYLPAILSKALESADKWSSYVKNFTAARSTSKDPFNNWFDFIKLNKALENWELTINRLTSNKNAKSRKFKVLDAINLKYDEDEVCPIGAVSYDEENGKISVLKESCGNSNHILLMIALNISVKFKEFDTKISDLFFTSDLSKRELLCNENPFYSVITCLSSNCIGDWITLRQDIYQEEKTEFEPESEESASALVSTRKDKDPNGEFNIPMKSSNNNSNCDLTESINRIVDKCHFENEKNVLNIHKFVKSEINQLTNISISKLNWNKAKDEKKNRFKEILRKTKMTFVKGMIGVRNIERKIRSKITRKAMIRGSDLKIPPRIQDSEMKYFELAVGDNKQIKFSSKKMITFFKFKGDNTRTYLIISSEILNQYDIKFIHKEISEKFLNNNLKIEVFYVGEKSYIIADDFNEFTTSLQTNQNIMSYLRRKMKETSGNN
jgi:hypothetical protein